MSADARSIGREAGRLWPWVAFGGCVFLPLIWLFVHAQGASGQDSIVELTQRVGFGDLLANSILLAQLTTVFALLLGLPLALLINLREFPGRRFIGLLYVLPLLIPPHIHTIAWTRVIGDQGWLTDAFTSWGYDFKVRTPLAEPGTPLLGSLYPGPAWIMACAFFPLISLSVSAGVRQLDGEAVEAAQLAGGRKATLWRVLLPQLAPRIVAGAVFVFVLALSTYPVVSLLNTPVLIQAVFTTFQKVDQSAGAVLATPLAVIAAVCVVMLGWGEKDPGRLVGRKEVVRRAGGLGSACLAMFPLLLAAGVPLISLIWVAGPIGGGDGPDNYQSVASRVAPAFLDSFQFALLGVAVLLLMAYPLGRSLAAKRSTLSESLALSSLALPPVAVAVALIIFWERCALGTIPLGFWGLSLLVLVLLAALRGGSEGRLVRILAAVATGLVIFVVFGPLGAASLVVEERVFLVLFAYLASFLPFIARMLRNGFRALDEDELHAARFCGHGALSRFARVELPRMKDVVIAAGVMAYVLCITELSATLLVLPPGWQSVQIRIFNMIHYRSIGEVAALCVLTILLAALPVVLFGLLGKKKVPVL